MWLTSLRRSVFFGKSRSQHNKLPRQNQSRIRPNLERLEDRIALSTITVNATDTAGLIAAINQANTDSQHGSADTISLTNSTYIFSSANNTTSGANVLPVITAKGLSIQGNGSTLNAGGAGRLFDVASGASVTVSKLTLTGGKASGSTAEGGAVFNSGQLTMNNVTIGGNSAAGSSGQNAAGGGIYSNGGSLTLKNDLIGSKVVRTLTISPSTGVTPETTTAGAKNIVVGGGNANAMGGGVYVDGGSLSVTNCVIAGNQLSGSVNVQGGGLYVAGVSKFNLKNDVIGSRYTSSLNSASTSGKITTSGMTNTATGGSNVQGGGLYVSGGVVNLTARSSISQNKAQAGNGASGGGNGSNVEGGGIYALNTTLNLAGGSSVNGNQANGGQGGNGTAAHLAGGQGGNAQGGGVFASASTIVVNSGSTIYNNRAVGGNGGRGGNGLLAPQHATKPGGTTGGRGGNGGLAQGGGLYADAGSVSITGTNTPSNNTSISSNSATGGSGGAGGQGGVGVAVGQAGGVGGAGGAGGEADGGGIYLNAAPLTVSGGVTIAGNGASAAPGGQGGQGGGGWFEVKGTKATVKSSYGGNGGNGGVGGVGGAAQGGGLFAIGSSSLSISLGDSAGGMVMKSNSANAGHGAGGGAGGKVGYIFVNGFLQTPKYIMGQGGQSGNGGAAVGGGAAIYGDKLTLTDATIQTNYVQGGGGGFNKGYDFSTPEGSSIRVGGGGGAAGGAGGSGQGGGLFVAGSSSVLILNSTLADNNANYQDDAITGNNGGNGGNGGKKSELSRYSYGLGFGMYGGNGGPGGTNQGAGLYATSSALSVLNSTIADNTLYDSLGGAYGTGTLGNGTAGANGSSQGGGVYATGGSLSLTNDTIAWNFIKPAVSQTPSGDQGAGIFASNTPTLQNTIVALNQIYNSTTATSTASDLSGAASTSDHNFIGADPMFAAPAPAGPGQGQEPGNYGGLTPTLPLASSSPALGAGNLAAVKAIATAEGVASSNATDQRGFPRVVNGAIDIGATETQAAGLANTTTTLSSSANPSVYGQNVTFTATVTASSGTPTGTVTFEDGSTVLGTADLNSNGVATFSTSTLTSPLSVGSHSITAVYGGDANDSSSTSSTVSQVVNQDSTTINLVSSSSPSVYSQQVTFTATVSASYNTPTGTVTFKDGSTTLGTSTLSGGVATFSTSNLGAGTHSITAVYSGDANDSSSASSTVSQVVNPDGTTTALTSSVSPSPFGQSIAFTATVSANSPGTATPTGTVDFVDTTTGNDLGTVALSSSGTASVSVSNLEPGSHLIEAIYSGQSGAFLGSTSATLNQSVTQSTLVLDPTDPGSLTLSGNASIKIPGNVVVDSSSQKALSESGNASITAASIGVVGGVSTSNNASLSPAAVTGIAPVANPLASLTGPSPTGLTNYGAVSYSNGTHTLNPGIYTSIKASGNASLTLNPGIYIIEGGGVAVTGNASISGSGVMLYNTSSNYPLNSGSYGGITLSGNGTFSLSAPTTGMYAGIVIFQPPANTRAISLSGNASDGLGGTIYAPAALLYVSGNASVNAALVVNQLSLSGNAASTQAAAGTNADNAGSTAGELLQGDVNVYVNNANGDLTSDELARIQAAVNAVDAVTSPYGVNVAEVTNPTQANVSLNMGTTSAAGNYGQGVLGCYTTAGVITLIQGWNWYAGADPTQIGANQYDFQTTVTHELGHALGLGESSVTTSAMYGTLTPATAIRTLTTADLNIPYAEAGADAQRAALPTIHAVAGMASGTAMSGASSPGGPNNGGPGSVFDQVFTDIAFLLSDTRNAYQSALSSLSALWQQADALALQRLDMLLNLEAGAMGVSKDSLMTALLFAHRSGQNGVW